MPSGAGPQRERGSPVRPSSTWLRLFRTTKKRRAQAPLCELISEQREKDARAGKGRFRGEHYAPGIDPSLLRPHGGKTISSRTRCTRAGDEALAWIEEHDAHGIVLAGRPYHNDPEINHAVPELVSSLYNCRSHRRFSCSRDDARAPNPHW